MSRHGATEQRRKAKKEISGKHAVNILSSSVAPLLHVQILSFQTASQENGRDSHCQGRQGEACSPHSLQAVSLRGMLRVMGRRKQLNVPGIILFGMLMCGISALFLAQAVGEAMQQARLLAHSQPVPALILDSQVAKVFGFKHTRYRPAILFEYVIEGTKHQSDLVFPLMTSFADHAAAQDFCDRFPVGTPTIAHWHSPVDAYLVPRADFAPYLMMWIPLLHFCIGLAVLVFHVNPSATVLGDVRRYGVVLGFCALFVVLAHAHYAHLGDATRLSFILSATISALILLPLTWWWWRAAVRARSATKSTLATPSA